MFFIISLKITTNDDSKDDEGGAAIDERVGENAVEWSGVEWNGIR
jgi:hypothetical protein